MKRARTRSANARRRGSPTAVFTQGMASCQTFLAALSGCLVYMLGAMSRVAVPGMVFERMAGEYGFTPVQIALLPSLGVLGCMAFIGLGGVAVDRFGWMRMLIFGSLLQVLGFVPVHESSDLGWVLVGEFLNGGGRTLVYLALLKFIDVSFGRRYFAALMGVFCLFGYGGTLGASTVFPILEKCSGSWQAAARAVNFGTLALTLLGAGALFRGRARSESGDGVVRMAFPWQGLGTSLLNSVARRAMLVTGLDIAVYWSFLCVCAAPFARHVGSVALVSEMNGVVMFGMCAMGSVSLLFGNRRRPFFLWGPCALALGFGILLVTSLDGAAGDLLASRTAFLFIGAGYGVTSVLLAGTKECVPTMYMASAIGFTNFFANVVQIGVNQVSGSLMNFGVEGYPWMFAVFLALSIVSFAIGIRGGCGVR